MMFTRNVFLSSVGLVFGLFGVNVAGAIAQQEQSLQNLPDGNYIYEEVTSPTSLKLEKFLFRKVGIFVAGYRSRTDWGYCFKGQLQDLSLINITMADPKFGRGISGFDFRQEKPVDLRNYQQVNINKRFSNSTKLTENLQECLNLFPLPSSPKISKSIPPVPASSKPVKPTNLGDGYPTDAEIQKLSREFQQILIPEMQRSRQFGLGKRDAALERFTQEWAKFDRSASFFLGSWRKGVDDLYIYPSSNQGQVCVIWTIPARDGDSRNRLNASFSIGLTSNGQLKADNIFFDRRKTVVFRSGNYLGTTFNRDNVPQVSPYSAFSEPLSTVESLPLANTAENRKVIQQFYNVGCTASLPSVSKIIPPVPASTTPVKPTDAIAKYPTNDNFKKVDRILQASRNPESLVNLKGNQQDQRRKFQKEWESRNPAAVKFLGGWYTGNKSFYVYPSTAKGGTCIVTQDSQGSLTMQIGTVLNRELRYGGGKGFFWIDRTNIIASRDSGSGDLYPIYATSEVPELSESMIGDMERQKCITALPFEADAQYYKERGDKFAKLGKKDDAISNYRKALELFQKQNLFAQIKTVESIIANLVGKPTTKPITQKPTNNVYSGVSPLYEDVKDPAYGLGNLYGLTGMTETFRVGLNAFEVVDNGQTVNLNSKVKAKVPTIIITHGLDNDLTATEFRNLLKAVKYNSSVQVLVVDWSQGSKTNKNVGLAASRIGVSASKVVDLIEKYNLDPSSISLIGHSLGAHLSVEVTLELQKRGLGEVRSVTLLDPAIDLLTGYQVKALSDVSTKTFVRAFYTSAAGSSSFAASANESYNIQFPLEIKNPQTAHGEAITLLANSFQGDLKGKRNCIGEQFMKLDEKFPDINQNPVRKRGISVFSKPTTDLYVAYDTNRWLYPKQIVQGLLDVNSETGNCKLTSDFNRTFDSIQKILN